MKRTRPILSGSPDCGTGSLSVRQAVDIIRSAGAFDEFFYLEKYIVSDPLLKFVDPISHYLVVGYQRGYLPSESFDAKDYRDRNMTGEDLAMSPILHFSLGLKRRTSAADRGTSRRNSSHAATERPRTRRQIAPDFSRFSQRPRRTEKPVIDVIMPVYAGYIETLQAIHAVLSSRNATPHELIVYDDCSPDDRLADELQRLARGGLISLFRNKRNMGFVKTVNRALAVNAGRNAILLNSDTLVFGNWIDRLCAHAESDVATITPFSNNAALCSYPRIFEDNDIPRGMTARALDRSAAKLNRGQAVDVPSGVGFCMYVSRSAFNKVGRFDEKTFGRGYGEENDFCQRALDAGFRNRQALDVFVFHKGAVSFGKSGDVAKERHFKKLLEKHPDYRARVRKFAVEDPALFARRRLDIARLLGVGRKGVVLYVVGPTDTLVQAIQQRHERRRREELAVLVRPDPGGRSIRLEALDGRLEIPNLKGIPLEGEGALFGGLLSGADGVSVEVHSADGYASGFIPELKRICRTVDISCRVLVRRLRR